MSASPSVSQSDTEYVITVRLTDPRQLFRLDYWGHYRYSWLPLYLANLRSTSLIFGRTFMPREIDKTETLYDGIYTLNALNRQI